MKTSRLKLLVEDIAEEGRARLRKFGRSVAQKSDPYVQKVSDNISRNWRAYLEEYIFIGLIVLSLIGVFISDFSPVISFWFWLTMIPLYALTAIASAWAHGLQGGISAMRLILTQVVHWGGAMIALVTTYSLWASGRFTDEHTGFVVLLLLALTTFTAGLHVGWRFYVAGIFLFVGGIITTHVREYMWILILALAVPIAIVGVLWDRFHEGVRPTNRPKGE